MENGINKFPTEGVLDPDDAVAFNILADCRWLSALENLRNSFNGSYLDLETVGLRINYTNYVRNNICRGLAVLSYVEWVYNNK
jgi:hypothetical protein